MNSERQPRFGECFQDLLVAAARHGNVVEAIFFHKFIKDVGTQNYRSRNVDDDVWEAVDEMVAFYHRVEESQAAGFATQRTLADARKGEVFIELLPTEFGNYAAPFVHSKLGNGFVKKASGFIQAVEIFGPHLLKKIGKRK